MITAQIFQEAIVERSVDQNTTIHLVDIIIMLVGAFLLGYVIHLIFSRKHVLENRRLRASLTESENSSTAELRDQKVMSELETRIAQLEQRNSDLRIKLTSVETSSVKANLLQQKNIALEEMVQKLQNRVTELESSSETSPHQPESKSTHFVPDPGGEERSDFQRIEGIGPKISEVLHQAGLHTYADLAARTAEQIRAILLAQGTQYKVHNPTTWPRQAELARDGKWEELDAWQHELTGGKIDE